MGSLSRSCWFLLFVVAFTYVANASQDKGKLVRIVLPRYEVLNTSAFEVKLFCSPGEKAGMFPEQVSLDIDPEEE